ncbi:hypothetical protein FACS1894200_04360 [Spirochaetia bacterium]|nr:hypothetical protein FACS1894200_04360 [Spirochaetia bacterium]
MNLTVYYDKNHVRRACVQSMLRPVEKFVFLHFQFFRADAILFVWLKITKIKLIGTLRFTMQYGLIRV